MKDERQQYRQLLQEQHRGATPSPLENEFTQIKSDLTAAKTALTTKVTDIQTLQQKILSLDALVDAFNNSPGTLSTADQAMLDDIAAASADLKTTAQAIDTSIPVDPNAPPPPATLRR